MSFLASLPDAASSLVLPIPLIALAPGHLSLPRLLGALTMVKVCQLLASPSNRIPETLSGASIPSSA